jgi:hypothetical protein
MIDSGKAKRAGLLATQAIRGGANRRVLERIKESGDIFWAQSDRNWILDGTAVHVSMVGFDDGREKERTLDATKAKVINSDLTSSTANLTIARTLPENLHIFFRPDEKGGPFDITFEQAQEMLSRSHNPNGHPNSDVVRPYLNAHDIVQGASNTWIIDFGCDLSLAMASQYEGPFEYVRKVVKPVRINQTINAKKSFGGCIDARRQTCEMQ